MAVVFFVFGDLFTGDFPDFPENVRFSQEQGTWMFSTGVGVMKTLLYLHKHKKMGFTLLSFTPVWLH